MKEGIHVCKVLVVSLEVNERFNVVRFQQFLQQILQRKKQSKGVEVEK